MPGRTKKAAKGKPRSKGKTTSKAAGKKSKKAQKPTRKKAGRATGASARKSAGKPASRAAEPKPAVPKKKVTSRVMQSAARVNELRAMLEAKRAEIYDEVKRAREDSMTTDHKSFPEVGDLVSASVEKERAFEHGEAGIHALREVGAALEKLKAGTYGICELCDKEIGITRLKVMPYARLCIKCKSKQEASGGVPSGR